MEKINLINDKLKPNKFIIFMGVLVFISTMNHSVSSQTLADDPLYQLVFVDEFDSLALNTNKWEVRWPWGPNLFNKNVSSAPNGVCGSNSIEIAYNYSLPGENINMNRQYDTIGTGYHRLISKRESPSITGQLWNYDASGNFTGTSPTSFKFSTAMLFSKKIFKYGYIEFKYRLSNIAASFPFDFNAYGPNLWMWRGLNDTSKAAYSEIDIFEQRGNDWKMAPCVHYRRYPNRDVGNNLIAPPTGNAADTAFWHANGGFTANPPYTPYARNYFGPYNGGIWHTVGCEWTPDYLDFFYDNNDTNLRFNNSKIPISKLNPMPLVIDIYSPAFQYCLFYDSTLTQMPFNYDVDYIKVYQIKQDCTPKTFLNTGSANYQSKLYQNVNIGGAGGMAIFNSGKHHICATDYVLLNEGFEARGGNTTVIVDTQKCQSDQAFQNTSLPAYDEKTINEITNTKSHD